MAALKDEVEQCIRRRRMLRPGQSVLVAVSGGVDSMVLLHLLHNLSPIYRWRLTVAHLNHQLRGAASTADERLVRRTARKLRLPLVVERAEVRQFARAESLSLEMAARKLRHEFLARAAAQRHIRSIALAHHADDQLELFFLRLLRGTSGEGLAGMKWRSPSPVDARIELVRPMLAQPKAALCQYAGQNQIPFREDATNASLDIQRNRIRHELLPLLRRSYQPALDRTVLRLMEIVGAEAQVVTEAAREWLGWEGFESHKGHKGYKVTLAKPTQRAAKALQAFDDLSVAVQRRCVQLQLLELGLVADFELVERLRLWPDKPVSVGGFEPTQNGKGQPAHKPAVLAVRDASGRVRLGCSDPHQFNGSSTEQSLAGHAGKLSFDGINIQWKLTSRKPKGPWKPRTGQEWFDADRVGSPILLRHWQPGDRFQPIGLANSVKLQDFFINEKIPQWRRHELLLGLTREGEVFWVEGLRIAERFKLTERTIRALQWRWHRLLIQ